MRIYHIKNSTMFNKKDKNGTHRYAVYYDRKSHELRAIQLTHIYEIPFNKQKQINNGHIKKVKLNCYSMPSGVQTGYITKNIDGNPLTLNRFNSRKSYSLSREESKKLKKIAKKKIK